MIEATQCLVFLLLSCVCACSVHGVVVPWHFHVIRNKGSVAEEVPIYSASGTHAEVYRLIGAQASTRIQTFLSSFPVVPRLRAYVNTSAGRSTYEKLLQHNCQLFPLYCEEMKALAEGAGVPPEDMLLLSLKHELETLMGETFQNMFTDCSDVLVHSPGNFVGIGHNEDGWGPTSKYAYFVNATFTDTEPGVLQPGGGGYGSGGFFAFAYPASINGHGFGVNQFGLFLSMNAIFANAVAQDAAVGVYFLSRRLLDCTSVADVVELMAQLPGCSFSGSFNTVSVVPNEAGQFPVANFEVAPSSGNAGVLNSRWEVSSADTSAYTFHFNNFLRLTQVPSKNDTSSVHRLNRAVVLAKAMKGGVTSAANVLRILGDTHDTDWPIFRTSKAPDNDSTLATALFDAVQRIMRVYVGENPELNEGHPTFTLELHAAHDYID